MEEQPRYTEQQVKELLAKNTERLGKVKEVIWLTKPNKLKLNVFRVIATIDGLVIEVK